MSSEQKIRLFVAVFPPAAVVERLTAAARRLAAGLSGCAVGWTPPEQIHLTLNFIGNVEQSRAVEFEKAAEEACRGGEALLLRARGLGCFPSPARPRILWAGLDVRAGRLEEMKAKLDGALARLGCAPEERPFHAHLTLGRVKHAQGGDGRGLAAALRQFRETEFGQWTVERVELMQSVLGPDGAKYSVVRSFHAGFCR